MARRRGFTLVEVLVATAVVGVGIASLFACFSAFSQSQRRMVDREKIQRLADQKLQEEEATMLYDSEPSGDFTDEGEPGYKWSVEEQVTGVDNLYEISVTVTKNDTDQSYTAHTLKFIPPASTGTTGADTANATGGGQ